MKLGVLIPGVFGLAWIAFGGDGLGAPVVAISGMVALAMLVAAGIRAQRAPLVSAQSPIGLGYWFAVAFEVVLAIVGAFIIGGTALPQSSLRGWIEIVVGLHFFLLSRAWMKRLDTLLGLLGVLFVLAGAVAFGASIVSAPVAVVSVFGGQVPGLLLAGFCLLATFRVARRD